MDSWIWFSIITVTSWIIRAESACYTPAMCGNQPAWIDVTVECESSSTQEFKEIEDRLENLTLRLDNLNLSFESTAPATTATTAQKEQSLSTENLGTSTSQIAFTTRPQHVEPTTPTNPATSVTKRHQSISTKNTETVTPQMTSSALFTTEQTSAQPTTPPASGKVGNNPTPTTLAMTEYIGITTENSEMATFQVAPSAGLLSTSGQPHVEATTPTNPASTATKGPQGITKENVESTISQTVPSSLFTTKQTSRKATTPSSSATVRNEFVETSTPTTPTTFSTEEHRVCYMGMMSRAIPNSAITASSYWGRAHEPYRARLDNQLVGGMLGSRGCWSARHNRLGQWLQVDFKRSTQISGIITQGRPQAHNQWIRSFNIKYGDSTTKLLTVQENGEDKIFEGNFDMGTKAYNRFPEVISGRFIRVYPLTWNNHISMRAEFVSGACFNNATLWNTRCKSNAFEFEQSNHTDYVRYRGEIPRMTSYSVCAWVTPINSTIPLDGILLSYCKSPSRGCNTIQIKFAPSDRTVRVINNGKAVTWSNVQPIINRSHVCFVMSRSTRKMHYYVNGVQKYPAQKHAQVISGGGVLIIGQDQDGTPRFGRAGAPQNPGEGFTGIIQDVLLWSRALSPMRIANLERSGCNCASDATITFTSTTSIKEGNVTAYFNQTCHELSDL